MMFYLAHISSWREQETSRPSQTRTCMIAHVCAYKCEHVHDYVAHRCANDCTHVCIHALACPCLCVHIHTDMITPMCSSMIAPMCAYSCRHDCNLFRTLACGYENLKSKQDKTKCNQLERLGTVYAHTFASIFMRHSGQLFGTKEGTKFACSWQQSGQALQQPCFQHRQQGNNSYAEARQ
jgi:hypothetical protein